MTRGVAFERRPSLLAPPVEKFVSPPPRRPRSLAWPPGGVKRKQLLLVPDRDMKKGRLPGRPFFILMINFYCAAFFKTFMSGTMILLTFMVMRFCFLKREMNSETVSRLAPMWSAMSW